MKRQIISQDGKPAFVVIPIDQWRQIESTLEDRGELSFVRSALRTLSRIDREALLLRAVGELSYDDIAVLLHTSPAAVKMRVSRARKRLEVLLLEHADGRRTGTA